MRTPARATRRSPELVAVAALTVLAALLRFATLDAKGFWEDEASTVFLVRLDLGSMLSEVADSERAGPLYYLLAKGWTSLFGTGEVGIRSLSALIGVAVVPVAYLAGRELVSRRAGVIVAALTAANPLLVWYSQEARAYELLVLLSGVALVFFARALRAPTAGALSGWAVASVLALITHWFAVFLVAAQGAWLLWTWRDRRAVLLAVGAATVVTVGLAPLALHQASQHSNDWIPDIPLASRIVETPGVFLVGLEAPQPVLLAAVAALPVAAGLWLLATRTGATERRGALVAGGIGVAGMVLPLAVSLAGPDTIIYRNLIATWLPLAVVVAAGFAASGAQRVGIGAAAVLCVLSAAITVATAWEPKYGREDWRAAAEALGPARGGRAIVITPANPAIEPMMLYLSGSIPMPERGARVREIDVLGLARRPLGSYEEPTAPRPPAPPAPPARGFALAQQREGDKYTLFRYRSARALPVSPALLERSRIDSGDAMVLLEPPRSGSGP